MDLNKEFQKYVGAIIKDPHRVTSDCDTAEGAEMTQKAQENGLFVIFQKVGEPEEPFMGDVTALFVNITRDGVPADKSWGWRIERLNVG